MKCILDTFTSSDNAPAIGAAMLGTVVLVTTDGYKIELGYEDGRCVILTPEGWETDGIGVQVLAEE